MAKDGDGVVFVFYFSFLQSRCSFEACWFVASQLLLVIDRKFFRL